MLETDAPDIPPHWLYRTAAQRAGGQAQGRNEPGELPAIAARGRRAARHGGRGTGRGHDGERDRGAAQAGRAARGRAAVPLAIIRRVTLSAPLPEVNFSDHGDIRYLHLGTEWVQGSMRLDEPFEIDLEYVQRMMAWLLFVDPASVRQAPCDAAGPGRRRR